MSEPYTLLPEHEQDSPAWHAARRDSIGASEVAAVLGLNPWMTRLDVYNAKMGRPNQIDPDRAYFGHALEPVIARWVEDAHPEVGVVLKGLAARSTRWSWLTATPDRILDTDGGDVPLELKTARNAWPDGVPLQYTVQVQAQLAVLDAPRGWLAVLHGGNSPALHPIDRDDEFIEQILIPQTRAFWDLVEAQTPPEPVTTAEAVSLWPGNSDLDPVEADTDTLAVWQRLMFARKSEKLAKAEADALALELQKLMGDATALTYGGQTLATWRPQAGARHLDGRLLKADHPDLYAAYTTQGDAQRRFLPKDIEVAA